MRNLVQQVKDIEAEADRVMAEARRQAAELEASVSQEVAELRRKHEAALAGQLEALKTELAHRTVAEEDRLRKRAAQIAARLKELDAQALSRAAALIGERLRKG